MNKFICLFFIFYPTLAMSEDFDCNKAITTIDINYCARIDLKKSELEMAIYLTKSKEHNSYDSELIKSINVAQKSWVLYAEAHCNSIYTMWREGTVRGAMHLRCKTKITKLRTHEIWENFLTYMDSTPPVLQEPKSH